MCKKWKNMTFFCLKSMNNNVWIPQKFYYNENLTFFEFWWNFLFLGRGGFVVKFVHVAAKVIRQHMFLITLPYFLDNNLWNRKNMIVLVHENHEKWPFVIPVQHFCSGFDLAYRVSSFRGSKYLPKIRFSNVCFFNMSV